MQTELNLLFAVLAYQADFLDLPKLTAACRAWAQDKSKPLADLLVERGWLSATDREFVQGLLERKLARHQHDARLTLNAIAPGDVCDALREVDDSDIRQSLSSWPSAGPVLLETIGETRSETDQSKSRYTWVSEVGHGGLGKVWLARDNDLAREVALKEIKPGSASSEAVRRLLKEAQITGQLQHPNIVPVYEVNRGSRPFYTMKLVKGETLAQAIAQHHAARRAGRVDPLSLPKLLNVFVKVCDALAYAHARGVIHRDLKPDNVVLGDYGEAIVLDWGLARLQNGADEEALPVTLTDDAQSEQTRAGATLGTPAYMAPEQARGRVDQMDHLTDIYGLGAILFEILTGKSPHQLTPQSPPSPLAPSGRAAGGEGPPLSPLNRMAALLVQIADGETPRARDRLPEVSPALDAVCAKAMARTKADRYATVRDLAADVQRYLADEPVSVWAEPLSVRAQRWMKQHRTAVTSLAATLLVGLVGLGALAVVSNQHSRELSGKNTELKAATRQAQEQEQAALAAAAREKVEAEKALAAAAREKAEAEKAETALARSNYFLADARWKENRVGDTYELLELVPEKHRNIEWSLARRQYEGSDMTLYGHSGSVTCVAWSPDRRWLASASGDKTIKVWDAATGAELRTLTGHSSYTSSVAFSPDGTRLASASGDQTIKVWDAATGAELRTLIGHTQFVNSVAFSPDGTRLASGSYDNTIKVWDAATGAELRTLTGHTSLVNSVAFNPDGTRLASGSEDETIKVWDAATGTELRTLTGHQFSVSSVAFSPNGTRLASASRSRFVLRYGEIKVWDAATGTELRTFTGHLEGVWGVVFSPDGTRLASASGDNTIKVWDAATGAELHTLTGHLEDVNSVAFSPDGTRLASGSNDRTIKVWDTAAGPELRTLAGHQHSVNSVAFSPDGTRLASGSSNLLGQKPTIKVWDAATGAELRTLIGHTQFVNSVAFSPDGTRLASGSHDETIRVWDTETGAELRTLIGHTKSVNSVAFSPDGTRLASGSYSSRG